jgi:tetratricopeptide (TPR) repeat protein
VPSFKCGKSNLATTTEFVQDVASRMRNRVQISTDALRGYAEAIEQSFGADEIDPSVFREKPELVADGDRAYWIGSVYALLGEKPQALAWLRRAIDLGNHNYQWFLRDKNWDKLRGDREYERRLAEIRNYADKYRQEFGASSF